MNNINNQEIKKLFYYTKARTLISILRDYKILMSKLSESSDFYERSLHRKIVDPYNGISDTNAKSIADNNRYVCFCTEPNQTYWRHLNKGYRLPNMWDTYADRHKGACIVIDQTKFIEENPNLKEVVIDYVEKLPSDSRPIIDAMQFKDICYKNEHEIRFISENGDEFCSIKKSIINIILGVDFAKSIVMEETDKTYESELKDMVKSGQVEESIFKHLMIADSNGKLILT